MDIRRFRSKESIFILVVSCAIFFACLLWLVSSLESWTAYQVERILTRGEIVPTDVLVEVLEKSKDLPRNFFPNRYIHVPVLIVTALIETESDNIGTELVNRGLELARLALSRDPSDAYTWAMYAYLSYLVDGPSSRVVDALLLSICIRPVDEKLIFWRLAMAALNHGYWTIEFTDFIRGQILIAFDINPRKLVETSQVYGFTSLVKIALIAEPEKLKELEKYVKKIPGSSGRVKIPRPIK